jgi:replication factor C subunit 1
MDEVDGMSSGDRGGIKALIDLLKTSHIPVICICNDRSSPKLRSLANYCLDLRFRRPTAAQIANKLMPILKQEGFDISMPSLEKLVTSTRNDIRQTLNMLQFWNVEHSKLSFEEVAKRYFG